MLENLLNKQTMIVSLDVDKTIFDRLDSLEKADFSVVEINATDPKILKEIVEAFPKLNIGAGNIVTLEQLEICSQVGVDFATSPGFLPTLAQTASIYSINYLPGIATLSEAMQVMSHGYTFARPLPANLAFCTLLNKYLPALRLIPADLEWDEVEHFLHLPAVAAVTVHNPEKQFLEGVAAELMA